MRNKLAKHYLAKLSTIISSAALWHGNDERTK